MAVIWILLGLVLFFLALILGAVASALIRWVVSMWRQPKDYLSGKIPEDDHQFISDLEDERGY